MYFINAWQVIPFGKLERALLWINVQTTYCVNNSVTHHSQNSSFYY